MKELIPYLMFPGNCEEAMNFYKDALGGQVLGIERYEDSPMQVPQDFKQKVMHMTLKLPNGMLMASDTIEKVEDKCSKIQFTLTYEALPEMQVVFDKMKAGGKVTMDIEPQFWGDNMGSIQDKYGIKWMFICPNEKK